MTSGFIPMVSTTPPPIDDIDNDFTDFFDENDDFGEFSSPVEEVDYSFPSISSPEMSKSLSFQKEDYSSDINTSTHHSLNLTSEKDSCKEVEIILKESESCAGEKKFIISNNHEINNEDSTAISNVISTGENVKISGGKFNDKQSDQIAGEKKDESEFIFSNNREINDKDSTTIPTVIPTGEKIETPNEGINDRQLGHNAKPIYYNGVERNGYGTEGLNSNNDTDEDSPELDDWMDFTSIGTEAKSEDNTDLSPNKFISASSYFPHFSVSPPESPTFPDTGQQQGGTKVSTEEVGGKNKNEEVTSSVEEKVTESMPPCPPESIQDSALKNTDEDSPELDDWMDFAGIAAETKSEDNTDPPPNKLIPVSSYSPHFSASPPESPTFPDTDEQVEDEVSTEDVGGSKENEKLTRSVNEKKVTESMPSCPPESIQDSALKPTEFTNHDNLNNDNFQPDGVNKLDGSEGCDDEFDDFADFESMRVDNSNNETHVVDSNSVDMENPRVDRKSEQIDDVDDFASFKSASDLQHNENELQRIEQNTEESPAQSPDDSFDCDFGAFENASGEHDGDFADFSTAPQGDAIAGDFAAGNGEDFGDFNSGTAAAWTVSATGMTYQEKIEHYAINFKRRQEENLDDIDGIALDDEVRANILSKDTDNHSATGVEADGIVWSGELWDQLEDIDNTIALTFIWNGSSHNKHLLDSLGMHTQNILFSGAKQAYYVPTYYAAGLGLIDASKGILKPMSAAEKITAISPTEKTSVALEELPSPSEPYPQWKSVADEHGRANGMIPNDASDSWPSSGRGIDNSSMAMDNVVAPVCSVPPLASVEPDFTMDLDYLDRLPGLQTSVKPHTNKDLIDAELLELTTSPTIDLPIPPKDGGTVMLTKILASLKSAGASQSSSTTITPDESVWEEEEGRLSKEARAVLHKLPDLSYMKSKVLMFPMNMSKVNLDGD